MNLKNKIENLIYQNADDFEVSKVIKQEVKEYLNSLNEIFEKDQGKKFLVHHTKNIDSIIVSAYKYILRVFFKEFVPLINSIPITIVALGSYGREQLCVYSDIDLMIVYKNVDGYNCENIIQKFIQLLWDSGLKLGHRVHTLDELFEKSKEDQTIKSAMIESRFLTGSRYLWVGVQNEINKIIKDEPKKYILQKLQEYKTRRKKYPFSMQPDIKNSPGGLRDFNTIFWIIRVKYNLYKIKDLPNNIITYNDATSFLSSIEFLYRVRSALHLSFGKKQDTLLIEYAPSIAKKLNMSDRQLIRKTFKAMHSIRNISSIVIKRITKDISFNPKNIPLLKSSYIDKGIFLCRNKFYTTRYKKRDNLYDIYNFLLNYLDKDIKYDITFISYLSNSKRDFENIDIKKLLDKPYIYHTLLAFYNSNILTLLFPPLRKVKHLEQFDGYHKYPVDIHSLLTVNAVENISVPFVKEIYDSFNQSEKSLLKLTCLVHDCGKGRVQDHSLLGANISKKFALEIGFLQEESEIIYTLIKYHTLMSNTANREDIHSEKIIFGFLSKIKTKKILKLLTVLTYADIDSVGKGVFSNNHEKLIKELYEISLEAIENKRALNEATKRTKKEKELQKLDSFKTFSRLQQKKILNLESNLLFFKYSPLKIVEISKWCFGLKNSHEYKIDNSSNLKIEIIRKDKFNLGYFLSKLVNYSVINMDIFKFFNGIKYFQIEFLDRVKEDVDIFDIQRYIENSFDMSKSPKLHPLEIYKNEIEIDCYHSKSYASFKIDTKDQKGLLANIMTVFDDIGVDIASAKIQTIKNRAKNLILIEKNGNFCKNKERIVKEICVE